MLWLWLGLANAGCFPDVVEPSEPLSEGCVAAHVRATGRAQLSLGSADVPVMVLPDTRLETLLRTPGDVTARLAWIGVQSGGSAGYIGVAGEAWVPAFQLAEARWDWSEAGLAVSAGLVDDLWGGYAQGRWGAPALNTTMALETGLTPRSDLGAWLGWERGPLKLTVSSTSGEGAFARERNPGTSTSFLGRLGLMDEALTVVVYAREGSVGLLRAPDHRVGGAAYLELEPLTAGVEALGGWGLAGDGTQRPLGTSLWVRTTERQAVALLGRVDRFWSRITQSDTGTTRLWLAGGPWLPWQDGRPRGGMWLSGLSVQQFGSDAGPIPGEPVTDLRLFTQLTAQFGHAASVGEAP